MELHLALQNRLSPSSHDEAASFKEVLDKEGFPITFHAPKPGYDLTNHIINANAVHAKRGGLEMKIGSSFLIATLMVVGLLVTAGPASAWSDSMPHYGDSTCTTHMPPGSSGQHLGTSYTFTMCRANSTADTWGASIIKKGITSTTICSVAMHSVPVNGIDSFPCSPIPTGVYTAVIQYTVPGDQTPYTHTDGYYYAP